MKEIILAYQGEMTLKGLNRGKFEARLAKTIRWRLEPLGKFKVYQAQSTVFIEPKEEGLDMDEAFRRDNGEEPQAADDDQYTYSGHVLELDEAVRTALLLELPSRILCKEDCRGLCDQCGADLNINECSCQKDLTHRNPFSALASLLNEDEEV